ncbi:MULTISPECIES: hypothetical protein [Paraburkholderia]|uniref:hypothetical protein n=1 Tax=Paraburkholderia TaxID=1822464 RepID=UPI00225B7991|nr:MULTISPECIES: hypothetical protein [Paraburkholderia]MCX4161246.1 hypothetical protein [Paraburkholderia megapolitana]MDN7156742.1 hypothetical protein [Paraburkholderia sp. CHISQ3]MDQ6493787.1 hypothetical protein [Paraburkholderia megapolitana]
MRLLLALLLLGGSTYAIAATDVYLNLDNPNSVAALASQKPAHYRIIQSIASRIRNHPPGNISLWLKTDYGLDGSVDELSFKTSYPPKKMLEVTLDKTRYKAEFSVDVRAKPTALGLAVD